MDKVPPELLVEIIYLLQVKDIIRAKLVCKQWNSIISTFIKIKNLVVCDYPPIKERYFATNEPVNCCQMIRVGKDLDALVRNLNGTMFINLRKLYVTNIYDKFLEIDFLNNFSLLQRLELSHLKTKGRACTLLLPYLTILNIDNISLKASIIIDAPALEKLRLNSEEIHMKKVQFTHGESVRLLEICKPISCVKLSGFQNLEHLYCQQTIKDVDLTKWPKLKEFQFYEDEEMFGELRKQRNELKMTDLKLHFYGFELPELPTNKIQTYLFNHYIKEETINLYGPNFCNLASVLPFIQLLTYSELEDHSNRLPGKIDDLIKRFVNLKGLIVSKKVNLDQFVGVLAVCKHLNQLELRSSCLEQTFFDDALVRLCPSLISLCIRGQSGLSFEFLSQLKWLKEFSVDQTLALPFVCKMLQDRDFEEFSFKYDLVDMSISCSEYAKELNVTLQKEECFYFDSKDRLLEKLRSHFFISQLLESLKIQ